MAPVLFMFCSTFVICYTCSPMAAATKTNYTSRILGLINYVKVMAFDGI